MKLRYLRRLLRIIRICHHFGLEQYAARAALLPAWIARLSLNRQFDEPLDTRLRLALESLGPIFIKFGQMLSTRKDIVDDTLAIELAKLQDQVPPFEKSTVRKIIQTAYQKPLDAVFAEFDLTSTASASIAQVHKAVLHNGVHVAVKILRPNISKTICSDLALLDTAGWLIEKIWQDGQRIRPRQVIAEFSKLLKNEQNLLREAGNASLLRRNFIDAKELLVPEIYWDYCHKNIMVMEWMSGLPILPAKKLEEAGVDVPKLAELGVSIFFKQVFRDGFFHADMHPGNILVTTDGRYIALDFGIVGTLTDDNRRYLAENFMGFFKRDYLRIAAAHIDAGWAPPDTPIDEFEAAIRTVCEQVFDRPLSQISFGHFLLQLFDMSREFNIAVQPQLILLQKTLLQIEGLGRQLDPDLDLWKTAKPYLEGWMFEELGWQSLLKSLQHEIPRWGTLLPQLPRALHAYLSQKQDNPLEAILISQQQSLLRLIKWLTIIPVLLLAILVAALLWIQY